MFGQSRGCIRGTLGLRGFKLGLYWAMLGPFWQYLGKTRELLGSSLGFDHQTLIAHTFLKALLEHLLEGFAHTTNGLPMVLQSDCSSTIEHIYFVELLISLSRYPCAAKTPSGTSARNSKCVDPLGVECCMSKQGIRSTFTHVVIPGEAPPNPVRLFAILLGHEEETPPGHFR